MPSAIKSALINISQAAKQSGYSRYELRKLVASGMLTLIVNPGVRPKLLREEVERLVVPSAAQTRSGLAACKF